MAPHMELDSRFKTSTESVKTLPSCTNENKLRLYARFKQATVGPSNGSRPSAFDPVGRAKYDAWAELKDMNKDEAKAEYCDLADSLLQAAGLATNGTAHTQSASRAQKQEVTFYVNAEISGGMVRRLLRKWYQQERGPAKERSKQERHNTLGLLALFAPVWLTGCAWIWIGFEAWVHVFSVFVLCLCLAVSGWLPAHGQPNNTEPESDEKTRDPGQCFEQILVESTGKALAEAGCAGEAAHVYTSTTKDQIFAVVSVSNFSFSDFFSSYDSQERKGCAGPPAFLDGIFPCLSRDNPCVNQTLQDSSRRHDVEAKAAIVSSKIHTHLRSMSLSMSTSIKINVHGKLAQKEWQYLKDRGFSDFQLPGSH